MKQAITLLMALLAIQALFSCTREPIPGAEEDALVFGARLASVEVTDMPWTKVDVVDEDFLKTNGFYVTSSRGTAGSDTPAWYNKHFTTADAGVTYTSRGMFWPISNSYDFFYGSSVEMSSKFPWVTVEASASRDIVCAVLASPAYKTKNTLEFKHIFARLSRVTVAAASGVTVANVSASFTPLVSGRYALYEGSLGDYSEGWSETVTGEAITTLTTATAGSKDYDLWLVPGDYVVTFDWDATNTSISETNELRGVKMLMSLKKGVTNNVTFTLGFDYRYSIGNLVDVTVSSAAGGNELLSADGLEFKSMKSGGLMAFPVAFKMQYSEDDGVSWKDSSPEWFEVMCHSHFAGDEHGEPLTVSVKAWTAASGSERSCKLRAVQDVSGITTNVVTITQRIP